MKRHGNRWFRLVYLAAGLALACERQPEATRQNRAEPKAVSVQAAQVVRATGNSPEYAVENSLPGIREPHVRKGSATTELMKADVSAYRAVLSVDDDAVYLLTEKSAYVIVPGSAPRAVPVENGEMGAVTRADFVYWAQGALWATPKDGGRPRQLAALNEQPQFLMANGDALAWLTMVERDRFIIQTLQGKTARTLLSYAGRIETAAMDRSHVYSVQRDNAERWRIGKIALQGGAAVYGASHDGPTPAKLAVADEIYYYDVKTGSVRKLPADLSREDTVLSGLICSPIAVAVRLYCPNIEGMFEIARHADSKIMPLFPSAKRLTMVAASSKFLVWLTDTGPDRLSLQLIHLELDDADEPKH